MFAQGRYTGNQLAVVLDADDLGTEEMQRIAQEMNLSETTFVVGGEPGEEGYRVRIFTPQTELPFAGHPSLGSAYVIREHVAEGAPDEIVLDLEVGSIPVTVETDATGTELYWMKQPPPSFDEVLERAVAAGIVGLDAGRVDRKFEPQVVSASVPILLVPLASIAAVREAAVDRLAYDEYVASGGAEVVMVFAPEPVDPENDLHVRMFAPALGIPEDPATGGGNGPLAGYLARHRYFGTSTVDVTAEQGYEIDRPSLLHLRAQDGDEVAVSVGGRVLPVLEGVLL